MSYHLRARTSALSMIALALALGCILTTSSLQAAQKKTSQKNRALATAKPIESPSGAPVNADSNRAAPMSNIAMKKGKA